MKQSINLVPNQDGNKDHWFVQVFVLPAGALMVLIVLVGGTVLKAKEVSGLRLEVQEMNQNREKLNQRIAKLARLYPMEERNPAMEGGAPGKPLKWSTLLREISRRLPPSVWLTRIESYSLIGKGAGDATPEKEIKISGIAREHQDVERLLFALENPTTWKDIRLIFSKKTGERGQEKIEFQITARLL